MKPLLHQPNISIPVYYNAMINIGNAYVGKVIESKAGVIVGSAAIIGYGIGNGYGKCCFA